MGCGGERQGECCREELEEEQIEYLFFTFETRNLTILLYLLK